MEFKRILHELTTFEVEFVVIGGIAAAAQGSVRPTYDLDICYNRTQENLERIVNTLAPLKPRLRDAPEYLPFLWDTRTLQQGLNFTLQTEYGAIDLLGEVAGLGIYERVLNVSEIVDFEGTPIKILTLDGLIIAKRATGRVRDLEQLLELEALLELRKQLVDDPESSDPK